MIAIEGRRLEGRIPPSSAKAVGIWLARFVEVGCPRRMLLTVQT